MKLNEKRGEVIPMKKGDKIQNPTPPTSMVRLKQVAQPQNQNPLQTKIVQPTLSPNPHYQQYNLSPIAQGQVFPKFFTIQTNIQAQPVIQTFGAQQFQTIQTPVQTTQIPTIQASPLAQHQTYTYTQPLFQQSFAQPTLNIQPITYAAQTAVVQPVQIPVQQVSIQTIPVIEKELRVEYVEQKKNVVRMVEQEIEEIIPVEKVKIDYVPVQTIIEKIPVPVQKPYFIQREIPVPLPRFQQSGQDQFFQIDLKENKQKEEQIIEEANNVKKEEALMKQKDNGQQLNETLKHTLRKIPEGLGYETYSPRDFERRRYIDIESPRDYEMRRYVEMETDKDFISHQQVYQNPYRQIDWNRYRYQYDKEREYLDYLDRWEQERYQYQMFEDQPIFHMRNNLYRSPEPYPVQNFNRFSDRI